MKNLLFILTLLIVGCATKTEISNSKIVDIKNDKINIVINNSDNEIISFELINNSGYTISVYNLETVNIERFTDTSWQRVNILPCPCGALCARPPEKVEILMQEKYVWTWDKHESWCGEKNEAGIPKTIRKLAINGKYRLNVLYSINSSQKETIYKEFELK